MDGIYFTIIILGPGLAFKMLNDFLYQEKKRTPNVYEYLLEPAINGLFIFFLSWLAIGALSHIKFLNVQKIESISQIFNNFNQLTYAFSYLTLSLVMVIIWWLLIDNVILRCMVKTKNYIMKERTGVKSDNYRSVYDGIFHNVEYTKRIMPVSLLKNGEIVTSGTIEAWNPPNSDKYEFEIGNVDEITEILEQDKLKSCKDKILDGIRTDYVMPGDDYIIRFYTREKLEKYWAEKYNKN